MVPALGGGLLWPFLLLLYGGRPGRVRAIRPCQGPVRLAF